MIGAWRERWLIIEPGKRCNEREQVSAINVGPRYTSGVSAVEKSRADIVQRNARIVERRLGVLKRGRQDG